MKNLVEVKNLKKNYGLKEAVKNISFSIKENEIEVAKYIIDESTKGISKPIWGKYIR